MADVAPASVLVVDDDAPVRRMLERTLAAEGYAVVAVADGGTALARAETTPPDAIVLDVAMPGMDGLAVARRLRSKGVSIPILMLTARDEVGDRVAGLDAGADDYLVKQFAVPELAARMRALLRRTRPADVRGYADLVFDPGIVLALAAGAVASLLVLRLSRRWLQLGDTFPELLRIPLVRRLVR